MRDAEAVEALKCLLVAQQYRIIDTVALDKRSHRIQAILVEGDPDDLDLGLGGQFFQFGYFF